MADISQSNWSPTDASNDSTPPDGWPSSTMKPSDVEPAARALMGAIKRFWNRINGTVTSTGSSGTYTLTYTVAPSAYVSGETYSFKADKASAGDDVVNINSLGGKTIKKMTASGLASLAADDIITKQRVTLQYDSTDDVLVMTSPIASTLTGYTVGTSADNLVQLDSNAKLPVVDGSQLTNLKAASTSVAGVVELATATEALAGTDTTRAVTAAGLASSQLLQTGGYIKLPGGLLIQWSQFTSSGTTNTVLFPTAFSSAVFSIVITDAGSGRLGWGAARDTLSQFTAYASASGNVGFYIAIGV